MLKCLNIECLNCKENECKILCENSDDNCASRIIPRYTPNYAEEQLNYAMENELRTIKARNKELILENEKLIRDVQFRDKCFYELNDGYIELKKEYKELKEQLKSAIKPLTDLL